MPLPRRSRLRVLAFVVLAAAVVASWFPFLPDLPLVTRDAPAVSDGVTTFDGSSALLGPVGMDWIAQAIRSEALRVTIEARTDDADQDGPARLLSASDDVFAANLMIGQDGDDLVVRFRRLGADQLGVPAVVVDDVFATAAWHRIELDLQAQSFRLLVDGVEARSDRFDTPLFAGWEPDQHTSVGDEWAGNRAWTGDVRRIEVTSGGSTVDLTAPAVLAPVDDVVRASRIHRVADPVPADPLPLSVLRVLAWVVLAAVVVWAWPNRLVLVGLLLFPFGLTLGKLFVAGRDPVLADAVLGLVGVVVGAALARNRPAPAFLVGATPDLLAEDPDGEHPGGRRAGAADPAGEGVIDLASRRRSRGPATGAAPAAPTPAAAPREVRGPALEGKGDEVGDDARRSQPGG